MKSFRHEILTVRPEITDREAAYPEKRRLAMDLRALRDAANMTQEDVATVSQLSLETVRRCEALTGEMPGHEDVALYRSAVGAQSS